MPMNKSSNPKNAHVIGIGVGSLLFLGGPLAGILFSVLGTAKSFEAVEGSGVPAEDKAKTLADGISTSMNALLAGGVVSLLGLVAIVVFVVLFLKSQRAGP